MLSAKQDTLLSQKSKANEELVRRLYGFLSVGRFDDYFDLLSDGVVYYAAGNLIVSGVHEGKDELKKIGPITFKETNGTHRTELQSVVETDSHVAVVDTWRASRNGRTIEMESLLVYAVIGGHVTEIREFIGDEAEHDAFWR